MKFIPINNRKEFDFLVFAYQFYCINLMASRKLALLYYTSRV